MDAPSLEVFKARLDGALGNLVWWEVSLPRAGGWNWMDFKAPSNPNHSMSLRIISILFFLTLDSSQILHINSNLRL